MTAARRGTLGLMVLGIIGFSACSTETPGYSGGPPAGQTGQPLAGMNAGTPPAPAPGGAPPEPQNDVGTETPGAAPVTPGGTPPMGDTNDMTPPVAPGAMPPMTPSTMPGLSGGMGASTRGSST